MYSIGVAIYVRRYSVHLSILYKNFKVNNKKPCEMKEIQTFDFPFYFLCIIELITKEINSIVR